MTATLEEIDLDSARALATGLKRQWRRAETADAAAALAEHPELVPFKSLVVELAYEEYLLREKTGSAPDPGAFAARFPAYRSSIAKMLDAHRLLVERPELLDPPVATWPEIGTAFEGLDLVSELGRGSFGRAYLAFDPGTDRLCVLKLTAGNSTEARVIGRLAHPHVTDVYWARAVGRRMAVCMPFVGVSTLGDAIAAAFPQPKSGYPRSASVILTVAEADGLAERADRRSAAVVRSHESYPIGACAVGARIADAVAYLHGMGIVHGDLKPSNVVIGPGGAPHLIDFNLASDAALPPALRGTPAYMAPEILEAAHDERSARGLDVTKSDLFSLGVVLYELLTGDLPFPRTESTTLRDLADAVRRGPPPMSAQIPIAVAAIVASCLAASPHARPASAADVAVVFDRTVRAARTRGRRRRWLAAAVTCLLGLAAIGAIGFSAWPTTSPSAVATEHSPATATEHFDRGLQFLKADQIPEARAEFVVSHEMSGDPWALAYVAYGMALDGQSNPSATMSQQAIKKGADSAEIRNNLGYALAQKNQPETALAELEIALRLAPGLQAAHYNRAMIRYQLGVNNADRELSDLDCVEDIEAALASGPSSADLHLHAARIYAASSHFNPEEYLEASLVHLRKAVLAGKDPALFRNDKVLNAHLGKMPEFQVVIAGPHGDGLGKSVQLRLVEPRR